MKTRVIKFLKRLTAVALTVPALALASEAHFDAAPVSTDQQNLQNGARLFVNYCLNCHGASMVRYNQLQKIGLDEKTITENLLFTGEKIGDMMEVALKREDAEAWFGTAPPDLSVIARAKGADYLYAYLRGFYKVKTEERATGWNNVAFPNVGMPHVLWDLQGVQTAREVEEHGVKTLKLSDAKGGTLSKADYDKAVGDIVSFMVWMAEPSAGTRKTIGIFVLIFLAVFYVFAHKLGKNYWKDIH